MFYFAFILFATAAENSVQIHCHLIELWKKEYRAIFIWGESSCILDDL